MNLTTKYVAEAVGTAVLVLVGCGAATIGAGGATGLTVNIVGIAFAFGLAVTAVAYALGSISGAHLNPAVTLAFVASGRQSPSEAVGYILAQCAGAIVGAGILLVILKGKAGGYDVAAGGLGQNGWGQGYLGNYGLLSAVLVEALATFIFVSVILAATRPTLNLQVAGLIIGLTLFALHFPFVNVTGLSVNPARSLGPAVFVGGNALAQVWLFLLVPALAGLAAGWVDRAVQKA